MEFYFLSWCEQKSERSQSITAWHWKLADAGSPHDHRHEAILPEPRSVRNAIS